MQLPASPRQTEPRVAILLSTYNGATFLREQLESLLAQSHENWVLYWRDDGSSDATVEVLHSFAASAGQGRSVQLLHPEGRLGVTASFLSLLRAVTPSLGEADAIAFADQDDVWLPQKLARGLAALHGPDARGKDGTQLPALYCARQVLVDAWLNRIAVSERHCAPTGFPAALAQNVATGCTIMLNREAVRLVAASRAAPATLHDWWCYLVVTAAGGRLLQDDTPVVLYRQHGGNVIGAPHSWWQRGLGAIRRGPQVFMAVLRQHVATLREQPELLSSPARAELAAIARALDGHWWQRLAVLRIHGLTRQNWAETLVFRAWFILG